MLSKIIAILSVLLMLAGCTDSQQNADHEIVITNGKILDGTGNPWFYADIAISGNTIAKIGRPGSLAAQDTIDAKGNYVTPGFIDPHSHAGSGLTDPDLSKAEPLLKQGITSVFINPDGGGSVDMKSQREELMKDGLGVNVAQLVPHGAVRDSVIGREDREPSGEEMDQMRTIVSDGMQAGAFGLSSGPFYAPGSYAETDELIALSKEAEKYGGAYTSHIRDESDYTIGLEAAVDEVIEVAREAELPGVVTHIKALGPPVWDLSETIVENIEDARDDGVEVFADQYPYDASATGLISALVPRWAEEGGRDALVERLEDEEQLEKIMSEMDQNLERRGGADRIQFRYYDPDTSIEGKTLEDVAEERNEGALETAVALIKDGSPGIVSFNMKEEDVHRFMQQEWMMTSSDGGLVDLDDGVPHPRNYGTFPRKIDKYILDEEVVSLAAAIRSMTSLPAQVFGMTDRGLIREGAVADITIFNPDEITDRATFTDPHQFSEGIEYVLINGNYALEDGDLTDDLQGNVLHSQEK